MYKSIPVLLAFAVSVFSAEISSYALLEKHAVFNPELKTEPREAHDGKEIKPEAEHPVYRADDVRNQPRAKIELVRSFGPVIKHDSMLADQPAGSTEINRIDDGGVALGNGYIPGTADVAYPDVPYAPGYLYDNGYSASNNYDMYPADTDLMDTSTLGLLWSQVPYGRTLVSFVGRTIAWVFNSVFILLLGSLLTVGVCTYTNLCSIAFHGVGPIHEEMRSLMTPDGLNKIGKTVDFLKTAIDKYQNLQKNEGNGLRRRRAIFNY